MADTACYDLVVLGGGSAAFAAITEASRHHRSTAIVNTGLPIGGTCVNVGCVPSKHLLQVGQTAFEPPRNPFDAISYPDDAPAFDWQAAVGQMDDLVRQFRQLNYIAVADHFDTDVYEGYGRFVDDTTIEVDLSDGGRSVVESEKVLIATGSSPNIANIDGIENVPYETSESILERETLPSSIIFIGGGYVALEWAQILHHCGVEVTILQRSERLLSGMEGQLGREIQQTFSEAGIQVVAGNEFQGVRSGQAEDAARRGGNTDSSIVVDSVVNGESQSFTAEALFVATGVQPNTADIGLDTIGVEIDGRGAVRVDDYFQTSVPEVYAAGDVIGEPMLETVAAKEGNHAVKNAIGDEKRSIDYNAVPTVIFTSPEIASVGTTEREYMAKHGTCSCRSIQMADLPRAETVGDTRGLLQVVKHHETDVIVGVHMVTPRAADMVSEATLAVKFGLTVDDIIDTIHPFPTFSEAFKRACQAFQRDVSTMRCCVE